MSGRRRTVRFRVMAWFRRHEPSLLAVLAVTVVVLTFAGARGVAGLGVPRAFYESIKGLAGNNPWGDYGLPGDIAKWLDLLLVCWVGAKAIMLAFSNRVDALFARGRKGHTIVCGLGERGRVLSESLLYDGEKVTILEYDPKNRDITVMRSQGARVVMGDGMTAKALQAVGCRSARRVIAVLPTDDENAAVVQALAETGPKRPPVFAHNTDTALWSILFDLAGDAVTPFSATDSSCADVFLESDLVGSQGDVVLAVYGTGPLAESIVIRAAKVWQAETTRRGKTAPLPVRVIGPDAAEFSGRRLSLRYPGIAALCVLEPVKITSFDSAEDITECSIDVKVSCATTAIVATGAKEQTVRCAMLLARCLPAPCQIVAAVPSASGLLDMMVSHDPALADRVKVVDLSNALSKASTLLGGKREEFARLAHEDWLRAQFAGGAKLGSRGSLRHWEDLPDGLKTSNRDQVAKLFDRMLPAISATVVPVAEWDPEPFVYTAEELELLARMEHDRWSDDRIADGWVLDRRLEQGDVEHKRTPWLVGWDELPEDMKQWDRETIERFPVLLARAGFRIKRTEPAAA